MQPERIVVKKVLRLSQIACKMNHTKKDLEKAIRKVLKCGDKVSIDYGIVKQSIDARHKPDIYYVYSVDIYNYSVLFDTKNFHINKVKKSALSPIKNAIYTEIVDYVFPYTTQENQWHTSQNILMNGIHENERPVIIGFGPAGMYAALMLAKAGLRPIIYERGEAVADRKETVQHFWNTGVLNEESNVQFGEGGAGTFSDGKLNTGIKDTSGRIQEILKIFVQFGASEEILYQNKPHIGTDVLERIVVGIRNKIIELGGEIHFNSKLSGIIIKNGVLNGIYIQDTKTQQLKEYDCSQVCLAIGHSARDTLEMLNNVGCNMIPKSFAVGVRIEHPQSFINYNAYGDCVYKLPAADYKLTYQTKSGRGVYSFCMCPGGYVVNASSEKNSIAVNGMSYSGRNSANANSALIVTVTPDDFGTNPLDGILLQRQMEQLAYQYGQGNIPIQLLGDFKENKTSTGIGAVVPCIKGGYTMSNINPILPKFVSDSLKEAIKYYNTKIKGFDMNEAILSGVESRTSSPVKWIRNEYGMATIKGLYPCGEGAGYAGGIISAAVDGIKTAEKMAQVYSFNKML